MAGNENNGLEKSFIILAAIIGAISGLTPLLTPILPEWPYILVVFFAIFLLTIATILVNAYRKDKFICTLIRMLRVLGIIILLAFAFLLVFFLYYVLIPKTPVFMNKFYSSIFDNTLLLKIIASLVACGSILIVVFSNKMLKEKIFIISCIGIIIIGIIIIPT